MKVKLILILITFLILAQNLSAQTSYYDKLEFALSVDQTEWFVGSRVMAKVTVKNISDTQAEITLSPRFELVKKEIPKGAVSEAYTYVSNEHLEDSKTFLEISINKNESQTVEFEVTKLGWRRSPESIFFGEDWYYGVPKGEYELSYTFWFEFGETEKKRQTGIISSNKIDIKLNSQNKCQTQF